MSNDLPKQTNLLKKLAKNSQNAKGTRSPHVQEKI